MTGKIRVGIVGATVTVGGSGWGAKTHVPALKALPDYELKAVCTTRQETALASKLAFGAELAFHDFDTMLACPDIDLVTVVTRVPTHHDLVMRALKAGKAVYCEWPLGATVEEAEQMAALAAQRKLYTAVGLQAHSDPAILHARELIQQGHIGEILAVNFCYISKATTRRGNGRIWQSDRKNGANILTIGGGHAIDALNFVLGDFAEVSARLATTVKQWHNTDTGEDVAVDFARLGERLGPAGRQRRSLVSGGAVPAHPDGRRSFEIYGREGTMSIVPAPGSPEKNPSIYHGPNQLFLARGKCRILRGRDPGPFYPDTGHRACRAAAQCRPGLCPAGRGDGGMASPLSPDSRTPSKCINWSVPWSNPPTAGRIRIAGFRA